MRENYAILRKPIFDLQILINFGLKRTHNIEPRTHATICGFASNVEVDQAPLRDFGSKYGGCGGYTCLYILIKYLHPMEEMKNLYDR